MPKIRSQMTTLEKIDDAISKLREEIANKKAEVAELENASAIIRRMEGVRAEQSLAGKTIRECAIILLREKSPQHYKELARAAIARGYRSQKGGDSEMITSSFWGTLNVAKAVFEGVGGGKFKLRPNPTAATTPAKK